VLVAIGQQVLLHPARSGDIVQSIDASMQEADKLIASLSTDDNS
jgi:hypothetical protein